ncbi:restriction endonuclease subunit S [Alloalcanivorax sp. C16-2]|uniref:restriction endonuclease subunit S n=1 Tax=Alloalcanivorax sp. C16-2 TaxID=3390052 RepID=UPI003970F9DE
MSKATKNEKKGLVPRLRFPEFREAGEWNTDLVKDLVTTVTPPKKLTSNQYEHEGMFPVVDQSQEYICGWTNDEHALVSLESPLIVFGDHTCALKIVDQPFVQGADGIKILKSKNVIEPEFLYQYLLFSPVKMESYKRHFSTLKEKSVVYPDKRTGEQQKIAYCLSSLDALIAAQADKIDVLKAHKKGLMQKLFAREGETVPGLRFPEFRDAGEWISRKLSKLLKKIGDPVTVEDDQIYREVGIRSHGKGIFHKEPILGAAIGNKRVFWIEENTLIVNIVFAWELAVANTNEAEKGMIASHRFPMYRARENKADVRYMKYFFLTHKGKELLWIASPGGAGRNKTLGQKDFENLEFLIPKRLTEQKKIADCLSSVDELIVVQTEKLDTLKAHKKGLMQQLFPIPEAVGV